MLLLPPVKVGGVPPPGTTLSVGDRGTIVVLSWCYRGTSVVLACYRTDAEMTRQERSLSALSMPGAKQQRGRRLTVGPEGGFGAETFKQGDLCPSSGKNFKMQNFGGVLSNFALVIAPPFAPGGYLAPTLRVSPSPFTERGPRQRRGWVRSAHCHFSPKPQVSSPTILQYSIPQSPLAFLASQRPVRRRAWRLLLPILHFAFYTVSALCALCG